MLEMSFLAATWIVILLLSLGPVCAVLYAEEHSHLSSPSIHNQIDNVITETQWYLSNRDARGPVYLIAHVQSFTCPSQAVPYPCASGFQSLRTIRQKRVRERPSSHKPQCPMGTEWDGEDCASLQSPSCPSPATLRGSRCVLPQNPSCPPGTRLSHKQCITCPQGAIMKGQRCVVPPVQRLSSYYGCKTINLCGHALSESLEILNEADSAESEYDGELDDSADSIGIEDDIHEVLFSTKDEHDKKSADHSPQKKNEPTPAQGEETAIRSPTESMISETTEGPSEFVYWVHYDHPTVLAITDFQHLPDRFQLRVDDRTVGQITDAIYSEESSNETTGNSSEYDINNDHSSRGTMRGMFRIPSGTVHLIQVPNMRLLGTLR